MAPTSKEAAPPKTKPAAAISTGRVKGAKNFTPSELEYVFDCMEEILPIGPDQWQHLADKVAGKFPRREPSSFRRKYLELHRKKAGTGDPHMGWDVRRAKQIKEMIKDKVHLGDTTEHFSATSSYVKPEPEVVEPPQQSTPSPAAAAPTPAAAATDEGSVADLVSALSPAETPTPKSSTKRSYVHREQKEEGMMKAIVALVKSQEDDRADRARRQAREDAERVAEARERAQRQERQDAMHLQMMQTLASIAQSFQTPSKRSRVD